VGGVPWGAGPDFAVREAAANLLRAFNKHTPGVSHESALIY